MNNDFQIGGVQPNYKGFCHGTDQCIGGESNSCKVDNQIGNGKKKKKI